MIRRVIVIGVFLLGIVISCQQGDNTGDTYRETLFESIPSSHTGIKFNNQLQETDTFNALFYEYYYNGSGVAVGDFNNDGLSDIFFGGNMVDSRVYINRGNFSFDDVTEQSNIDTRGSWVTGISLVDINQDNWLDIYVNVGGNIDADYRNMFFINNGDPDHLTFEEQAAVMGLDDRGYSNQSAFFDYDGDGDLDMYVVTTSMTIPNKNRIRTRRSDGSMRNTDRLYRNEGIDQTTNLPRFKDVSREAGIGWGGFGLGLAISDVNMDGWPDIYVANDYVTNDLLYMNQGDGTFIDMAGSYFKHTSYSAMGTDIADINNDGLQDIITVDMLPADYFRKRIMAGNNREYNRVKMEEDAGYSPQNIRNTLQLNNGLINGRVSFSEIGQLSGIHETDWSWVPLLADFDNDGYRDLFVGNGIPHDLTNMDFGTVWAELVNENPNADWNFYRKALMKDLRGKGDVKLSNYIFQNSGHLVFKDKTREWGLSKPSYSTGAAYADFDNDGDLDLVVNNLNDPPMIYRNTLVEKTPETGASLQIKLAGSPMNTGGLGSLIRLYYGDQQQVHEHFPVRGFQSTVDAKIHFGLGSVEEIDSLYIRWPDGKEQMLYQVKTTEEITLKYTEGGTIDYRQDQVKKGEKWFKEVSEAKGLLFSHHEREFVDFLIQPLITHQYSKEGPGIAVGDMNGDGLEDFFVGNGNSYAATIFLQDHTGVFNSNPLPGNQNYEDMGALLFDADSDGDQDLFVVSGGTGLPAGNELYRDRIYINDGKGGFTMDEEALPDLRVCGSKVSAGDYDRDGDLDLFVCGRVDLENYPIPPRSYLLRNDSKGQEVRFTDVSAEVLGPDQGQIGLISDALWTDFNLDGWVDLVLVGEWMPITFLQNNNGQFTDVTSSTGLAGFTGWWNSIVGADIDKDGDTDYVAGNLGLNSRFKASQDEPVQIFAGDFDRNGALDPIASYFVQGTNYPIHNRDLLIKQLPVLRKNMIFYEEFARSDLYQIFPNEALDTVYRADARYFQSAFIENKGNGSYEIAPLPIEAQFSPVYGILTGDFNNDGNQDLMLTGNSYSSDIETGNYDASIGTVLAGDGNGGFVPISAVESNFFADGDTKGTVLIITNSGKPLVLVAQNSGDLKAFEPIMYGGEYLDLAADDLMAEVTYESGKTERKEFYFGNGYLSGSSRKMHITNDMTTIKITSYTGIERTLQGPAGDKN
ncbi:MAG: hypothetical protein DHS20C17_18100 [Cyclobacteriaceae bacterium]|nr:MAG: hypothetical protein DHS20C17_18100 [Cyclobacteriaceae bacterium]